MAVVEEGDGASVLPGDALLDVFAGFVAELRAAGLPVSLTEDIDAMQAVRHVPITDREALKAALAATLVKTASHWKVFDTVFEVYFSLRGAAWRILRSDDDEEPDTEGLESLFDALAGADGSGGMDGLTPEELAELLYQALLQGDQAQMQALAREAVSRFSGMEPGRPVGGTYYLYRTLRQMDLEGILDRLLRTEQETRDDLTDLDARLLTEEYQSRLARMRDEVESEIRRRLVADRGAEAVARTLRKPLPEDVDFMHAGREELVQLRKAIQPLTRKLAVRLARKRRHLRRGPLDFRATVRHSLSYGGVPVEPRFKHPRPHKPEIMVVADISGSVASFARFTLHLVYAMSSQFSKVRSFAFVDGIDEVTRFFDDADDIGDAINRVNAEADVVWVDGHSDYGHAFEVFWERWGGEIGPATSVIFLGDARNNYHSSQAWVVQEIRKKARNVFWLNPEPRSYWDTGDSIVSQYGVHCDGVFECRNLRQLERFVEQLA